MKGDEMKNMAGIAPAVLGIMMLTCSDIGILNGTDNTQSGTANKTLAGCVYREVWDAPVANATVRIYGSALAKPEEQPTGTELTSRQWFGAEVMYTTYTDDSGCFEIDNLDTGSYALQVSSILCWSGRVFSDTVIHLNLRSQDRLYGARSSWKLISSLGGGDQDSISSTTERHRHVMVEVGHDSVVVDSIYIASCETNTGSCALSFGATGPVMWQGQIPRDYRWVIMKKDGAYRLASAEYPISCRGMYFTLGDFAFEEGRDSGQPPRSATLLFRFRRFIGESVGVYGVDTLVVHEEVP
jgi:hypothetical protein